MLAQIKDTVRGTWRRFIPAPEGERGILRAGHREYVGGRWDEIGALQFDFLLAHGLRPENVLLDIACGSFRLGVRAIPYLDAGNYHGIEKERSLIEIGVAQELGHELVAEKRPELVVSAAFEFDKFPSSPDFAIAQSLFTHLTPDAIALCLRNASAHLKPSAVLFATYHLKQPGRANPAESHDHGFFSYTREEMVAFGISSGLRVDYIGDWQHPRHQVMVAYRPDS